MRDPTVDICVIEDDASQRALLVARMRKSGYSVVDAADGSEGLRLLLAHRPSVVICDVIMPGLSGVDVCRQVRSDPTLDGVYVLLVTASDCDEQKYAALNAGADDYLRKPYDLIELDSRVRSGIRFHKLQERLRQAAVTDPLTGLANHGHFRELLEREFARTQRYGSPLSLIMVDLDHFKAINDNYGHETGNVVLQSVARHLRGAVRDTDLVARYGGEEFAIICPETATRDAKRLAERFCAALPEELRFAKHADLVVNASLGVASTEGAQVHSVADLINLADKALYQSKRDGRGRVTVLTDASSADEPASFCLDDVDRLRKEVASLSLRTKSICLQSVWALIQALEARDGYSAWHSRNVTLYVRWLVEAADWTPSMRTAACNAAMLHDLGKIGVPDGLLLKARPLDPHEAAVMRQVPLITCKILEPLKVFETEVLIIRHLRERWDGAGYPSGLVGKSIPVGSRVVAIAEAFDSLTTTRADRPGRSVEEALLAIRQESGGQFDPEFVDLLERCIREEPQRWANQVLAARNATEPAPATIDQLY